MESFHARYNLEEELMIAMRAPQLSIATTAEQKDEARARILATLIRRGGTVEVDTLRELRDLLGLCDMSLNLFKKSLWHLRVGDRDYEGKRRITINEPEKLERFRSPNGHRIAVRVL